ncbi:MAG TPA: hypothetical protein VF747_12085 [Blastocatellia bacterium]|jgi:hypothetical protein
MRIRPNERQYIADIIREELEQANQRISERIFEFECQPAANKEDSFACVRRFYTDLVDKDWTEADEETLNSFSDLNEDEIKRMMREAFRRSRVHPVPNFASLINVLKRNEDEANGEAGLGLINPDAVSASERERIANVLHKELTEAVDEIANRLKLGETKAEIVREQLEIVEGAIVGRFTPLV